LITNFIKSLRNEKSGIRYLWTQNEGSAAENIRPSNGFRERKNPHHNAVLAGLWTWGSKWAPFGFFRLFWSSRTCTPKPGKAPIVIAVGSKNIFQSRARQGQQSFVCYSTSFTYIWNPERPLKESG